MSDTLIGISTIAISGLLLALGLFVGLSHAKVAVKWSFTMLCIPLALWTIFNTLADVDVANSLIWTRLSFASAAIAISSLAIFVFWFPSRRSESSYKYTYLIAAFGMLFALISLTSKIVPSVQITEGYANVVTGEWYLLYSVYVIALVVLSLVVLMHRYKKERGVDRERVKYVLLATGVTTFIAMMTNLIIPLLTGSNPLAIYGSFAMLLFIAIVALSVIRHRLFSIRIATARAVAYVLSGVTLGLGFGMILYALDNAVFGSSATTVLQRGFYIFSAVVVGFSFPTIKGFFDSLTRQIFLRDFYDPETILTRIATIVAITKTSQPLLKRVTKELQSQMHLSFVEAYLLKDGQWKRQASTGPKSQVNHVIEITELVNEAGSIVVNMEKAEMGSENKDEVALIVILRTPQGVLGYFSVGYKQNGVGFTTSDHEMLEAIANEVAIATENYLRLEEIETFNEKLQQNIDEATSELKTSNKKLKELDASKDEFISMASHQLRTPLTSVKGYLSMVLDGDMGEISPQQRKVLEEAYTSSQRMVYLIGDFLNVSRLQTGKFELELSEISLPSLIAEEIAQLKATAKTRGIELAYDSPQEFPKIQVDENKIRQVMMNFIDNAIYYSPENTTITVSVQATAHHVTFRVNDQGIGVPPSERHRLFTKFYRASNAKKQRPDGTGIGLFMAKKVVVAHGGTIIFETTDGKGSVFGFRLPKQPKV